jgi:Fe-S-cluster-containing hydrogenase component 2
MIEKTGIVSPERLREKLPQKTEHLRKGPLAVIECFQPIPCDPCVEACPRGAISPLGNITEVPAVDFDKCNGCGLCVFACPGLAIFIVEEFYREDRALVKIPYEFCPLPRKGEGGTGRDREGQPLCPARVVKVQRSPRANKLHLLWLEIPREFAHEVRFWKKEG